MQVEENRKRRRRSDSREERVGPTSGSASSPSSTSSLAKRIKREKKDDDEDNNNIGNPINPSNNDEQLPLRKCVLCTTGFDNEQRERTFKMARECGASIKGDLTKKTTHLLVLTSTAPSKSKKYEFAVRWGVHVVPLSWLEACHAARARVPEADFPVSPPEELASTQLYADAAPKKPSKKAPKDHHHQQQQQQAMVLGDCVCGVLGTEGGDSLGWVGAIVGLGGRAFTVGERDFPREMTHLVVVKGGCDVSVTSSAISAARGSCKGFVAAVWEGWIAACQSSGKRVPEEEFLVEKRRTEDGKEKECSPAGNRLFAGCVFASLGFSDDPKSEKANESWVRACGGDYVNIGDYVRMSHDDDTNGGAGKGAGKKITHVIVAHGTEESVIRGCGVVEEEGCAFVSQQWIEASRMVGALLDPACCPVLRPLPRRPPYESMRGVTICFTGLPLEKLFLYTLLARDVGATVTNNFYVRQTTHLVCGRFEGPKYDKAVEAGVPTVSLEWLEACAAGGSIQDYSLYLPFNVTANSNSGSSTDPAKAALRPSNVLRDTLVYVFSGPGEGGRPSPEALGARRCAVRLGAQIAEEVCFGVSHCIHVGERVPEDLEGMSEDARNELQREAEAAGGVGAYFVSAEWLALCEQKGERVEEAPFVIQNPLKPVYVLSQKLSNDDINGNANNDASNACNANGDDISNGGNAGDNQNRQIGAKVPGLQSPHKALSTPLGVIGLRPNDGNLGAGGGGGDGRGNSGMALFFPTQPQRTYSRKRNSGVNLGGGGIGGGGGKRSNMNAMMGLQQFESPGYLFRQNEQLLNEMNSPQLNSNSNSSSNSNSNSKSNSNLAQMRINEAGNNSNENERNDGDDGSTNTTKKSGGGDDAVLLECLSGLRGLQAKEGGPDNGSEALPITRSGNKHRRSRHSGNERKTHRTRLLVDPFSDHSSTTAGGGAAGTGIGAMGGVPSGGGNGGSITSSNTSLLFGQGQNQGVMTSYGDSEMMGLNGNNAEGDNGVGGMDGNGNGGESGNESEELFDNPSQIIAYAADADQRKREDLRRRLQNSK